MSETAVNDAPLSKETSVKKSHPPITRAATMPTTPTSPLAENPWYRQKFEFVCLSHSFFYYNFCTQYRDAIEEKVRDEYPDLPEKHKLEPTNIEHSTMKGYDLDFPVCNL